MQLFADDLLEVARVEPVRADDGRDFSTVERDTGLEAAE